MIPVQHVNYSADPSTWPCRLSLKGPKPRFLASCQPLTATVLPTERQVLAQVPLISTFTCGRLAVTPGALETETKPAPGVLGSECLCPLQILMLKLNPQHDGRG